MTLTTKSKIEEARRMMENFETFDGKFYPMMYEDARREWPVATPAWQTLKKYAKEAGLESTTLFLEWHSDGSPVAELCGMKEGELFSTTAYFFKK